MIKSQKQIACAPQIKYPHQQYGRGQATRKCYDCHDGEDRRNQVAVCSRSGKGYTRNVRAFRSGSPFGKQEFGSTQLFLLVFESDKPDTLAEAMAALEEGLAEYFELTSLQLPAPSAG